jgi:hypothetical protein
MNNNSPGNDAFFNHTPDFGFALPAFRAAKRPHYANTATPEAKRTVLQRRRSSQSFGSSYGAYGEKKRVQEQQPERNSLDQHLPHQTQPDGSMHFNEMQNSTSTSSNARYSSSVPTGETTDISSPPRTASSLPQSGLLLARAPSRDIGSINYNINFHHQHQYITPQSPPLFQTQREAVPFSNAITLERNALLRHTKRLKSKGTKPALRRSSSLGPTNSIVEASKVTNEGSKNTSRFLKKLKRRRSTTDITSTTVSGLLDEMREFYQLQQDEKDIDSTFQNNNNNKTKIADMLQRESVRFHPAIVANTRLLYNTFTKQYGRGFGFGQYVILCRKLLMAVLGDEVYSNLSRKDVLDELVEDWKEDSRGSEPGGSLNFKQFSKAMYHLIDAWSPGIGAPERIEWFDRLVQKVIYHDVAGNTFMVEDHAVNDIHARKKLEQQLHKSLMVVQSEPTTPPRMFRPRRMSLHRGMMGGVAPSSSLVTPTATTSQPSTQLNPRLPGPHTDHINHINELEGGESGCLIESPTINATIVQKRSGTAGSTKTNTSTYPSTPIDGQNSRASSVARAWTAGAPGSTSNGVINSAPTEVRRNVMIASSQVDAGSSVLGPSNSHLLDSSSVDNKQNYSLMMAQYPKDEDMSGLLPEDHQSTSSAFQIGLQSNIKFDGSQSGLMNDSVDIRSCVLLGNPQPFRTWDGEVTAAPRDVRAVSLWLQKFSGGMRSKKSSNHGRGNRVVRNSGVIKNSNGESGTNIQFGNASIGSVGSGESRGSLVYTPNVHSRGQNTISLGTHNSVDVNKDTKHLSSSREFRFQTKDARKTKFAKVTSKLLKAHMRQFRQDKGFSLWMRKDLSGYIEDRGHYNLERLSLKAKDFQIQTSQKYQKMDSPKVVLRDANNRMNDRLEKTALPPETNLHLKKSFNLPSVIVPNSTGQKRQQRSHKVSTLHHISEFIQATPAPVDNYKIVPFKEMGLPAPYVPPPIIDSSSTFSPICGITRTNQPEKYQRRYALPVDLPEAKTVVGIGFEMSTHIGKDAEEAAAVQSAIAAQKRNVQYKLKKLRSASRRGRR